MSAIATPERAHGDWRQLDLAAGGRSLIQASAGTGKTWTVSVLYLRLLLEHHFSPRQILVTTFTNAAAEELRERLRARVLWAEDRASAQALPAVDPGHTDEDWLNERWAREPACREQDLQRLRVAIAELDLAPIATLHGLCQRVLSDHPFAAGVPFRGGDLVSIDSLVGGLSRDLLRRLHQGDADADPLVVLHSQANFPTVEDGHLKLLLMPGSQVYCRTDAQIRAELPAPWSQKLRALCARDEFFNKSCSLRTYWGYLADVIENPYGKLPTRHTDNGLKGAGNLKDIAARAKSDPDILAAASFAVKVAQSGIIEYLRLHKQRQFWKAVSDWARGQAKTRLMGLNQRTYDDLLRSVSDALHGPEGASLADALFAAWPVAMVDEFQDTDAVQYGILDRIYSDTDADADATPRGRLVMIGDPKQAIYRFRGGDIETYLDAARRCDPGDRLTLDTNQRSSRAFVQALNEFFAVVEGHLSDNPGSEITCKAMGASGRQDGKPYRVDGQACSKPLVLHCSATCPDSAGERREVALEHCAAHIDELLHSGRHRIAEQPLAASDIAVLVPGNHELNTLRDLLAARGIPCVTTARSSVFATAVARDLQVILYAVAHCSEPGPVRAAMATGLWGEDYATLRGLSADPAGWERVSTIFHAWNRTWQSVGVQSVVEALIERVACEHLGSSGGERTLTDLRHLGELLQAQSQHAEGPIKLLTWLHAQREPGGAAIDEAADSQQLRIESDARRVRLMTLHASKGLEFPIVILPLMWDHKERPGNGLYRTHGMDGQRWLELTDAAKDAEQFALQEERFRILYVALTRAVHACHVYALPMDRPQQANRPGPAQGTARTALDILLGRLRLPLHTDALAEKTPHINWMNGWRHDAFVRTDAVPEAARPRVARTPLPQPVRPVAARHSFSTMVHSAGARAERVATAVHEEDLLEDEGVEDQLRPTSLAGPSDTAPEPAEPHPVLLELSHVKGTDFGSAVHAILEKRIPRTPLDRQSELVHRQLVRFNVRCRDGKDQAWLANVLVRRLQVVLDTPLGAVDGSGARLGDLAASDMRAELEFHFVLDGASMSALRSACADHGEPDLAPASNRTLVGLMSGAIDLVFRSEGRFHLVDYKGSDFGNTVDDYSGAALLARLNRSHYRFQALVYVVALDRYLRQRLSGYDRCRHLGDCYGLFIRAMGLREGAGIWRHRFSDQLLDAVDAVFARTQAKAVAA